MNESKLPLGICRHCVAALDAAKTDIHEIMVDDEVNDEDKQNFAYISDVIGDMMATIINMTNRECDEEDFMAEHIDLKFEDYHVEEPIDLLDEEVE